MITNILIEGILAIAVWFAGRALSQAQKRDNFVVSAMRNESLLSNIISRSKLDGAPLAITVWAEENSGGYPLNIQVAVAADKGATRMMKIVSGLALMGLILGSYFFGMSYVAINMAILFLSALPGISEPARHNALLQILILAVILDRWRTQNVTECERWIEQAWSLGPLYNAVKTAQ